MSVAAENGIITVSKYAGRGRFGYLFPTGPTPSREVQRMNHSTTRYPYGCNP